MIRRSGYVTWVLVCAAGEFVGLAAAASWWVLADQWNPEPAGLGSQIAVLLAKSAAGVGEGLVLGVAQGLVLRQLYRDLDLGAWIMATILIAVFGWAAGSAVSVFSGGGQQTMFVEPPMALILGFAALFGVIAGAMFGAAQYTVLRRVAEPASLWIVANALGWAAAMPIIYFAASLDYGGRGPVAVFTVALTAGLVAGACVGALTGLAFRWMSPAPPQQARPAYT